MSTRFNSDILAIFGAYFAHLKRGAHFAIEFVLFLGHFDVTFGLCLNCPTQIRVDAPPIWVQIAETRKTWGIKGQEAIKRRRYLQSLSVSIEQSLAEALVLRNGLQNVSFDSYITDSPLAQSSAT